MARVTICNPNCVTVVVEDGATTTTATTAASSSPIPTGVKVAAGVGGGVIALVVVGVLVVLSILGKAK